MEPRRKASKRARSERVHWRLWRAYVAYWRRLLVAVRVNATGHWPIFATVPLFPLVSGALLYLAESGGGRQIRTYGDAVYVTWITMATVGYGDMVPETALGKTIASVDALAGLVVIGLIVWFFSSALSQAGRAADRAEPDAKDEMPR